MLPDIASTGYSERSPALSLVYITLLFLLSLPQAVSIRELTLYRLAHFDAHGYSYGTTTTLVDMELATINSTTNLARKCILAPLKLLGVGLFTELVERSIGAMVVIIPDKLKELGQEARDRWLELETHLMAPSTPIPVFFAPSEHLDWTEVYQSVRANELVHAYPFSLSYLGFIVSDYNHALRTISRSGQPTPHERQNVTLLILQGALEGRDKSPTITISANIDTACSSPLQCFGYRACGSVASLLTLANLFSRLYSQEQNRPDYNLLFLLTVGGGSNLNFITLREAIESAHKLDTSNLHVFSKLAISLDDLGEEKLYAHFVRTPSEGGFGAAFINTLDANMRAEGAAVDRGVNVVVRKAKLNVDTLAWPHERFALNSVVGTTLSSHQEADSPLTQSVLDREGAYHEDFLFENTQALAETIARLVYGIEADTNSTTLLRGSHSIEKSQLHAIRDFMYKYPRPIQALHARHPLIVALRDLLGSYTSKFDFVELDFSKRYEGEYKFYDELEVIAEVSKVKPPIFDLILFVCVLIYLGVIGGAMYWVREHTGAKKRKEKYH